MKIIIALFCISLLVGCSAGEGTNRVKCHQHIVDTMNTTDIQTAPGGDWWKYLVRTTNGEVWYVEMGSHRLEFTDKVKLFGEK